MGVVRRGWVGMEGGREERGQASSAPIQLHPHTNPTIATVLNVVVGVWVCLYACVCLCVSVCVCVRSHTPFVVALLCDCLFQYVIGLRLGGCCIGVPGTGLPLCILYGYLCRRCHNADVV